LSLAVVRKRVHPKAIIGKATKSERNHLSLKKKIESIVLNIIDSEHVAESKN